MDIHDIHMVIMMMAMVMTIIIAHATRLASAGTVADVLGPRPQHWVHHHPDEWRGDGVSHRPLDIIVGKACHG